MEPYDLRWSLSVL